MSCRCCAFARPRRSLGGGTLHRPAGANVDWSKVRPSYAQLRPTSDHDELGKVLRRARIGWLNLEQAGTWGDWFRA